MTQAQVDAINSGITKSIVDNRVIPSLNSPGWAENSIWASFAFNARKADTATTANTALSANSVKDYSETLLSGLTEDDQVVTFYILTKNS